MAYKNSACDNVVVFAYDDQTQAQARAQILADAGYDVTLYSSANGFRLSYNDAGTLSSDDKSYVVVATKS